MNFWVSTDLDGTLLDHHTYSFEAAIPALNFCLRESIPVILNTSKTAYEAMALANEIDLDAPLIVENGSALVNLRPHDIQSTSHCSHERQDASTTRVFGAKRENILSFLAKVRDEDGFKFEGFNDWSVKEIAQKTGLSLAAAELAAAKEYSEPFVWQDSPERFDRFKKQAQEAGFSVLKGGRFYHLQGKTDKAKPLRWIRQNLEQIFPKLSPMAQLICLGDNHNDIAMLEYGDRPVLIRSPKSDFPSIDTDRRVIYTRGEGPVGWHEAMQSILGFDQSTTKEN